MSFSSSPTKRSYRQSSLSISSLPQSSCSSASPSRPQSPSMLRRPASSIALRSPTPNHIKRPNTPSGLHYSNLGALHSTPNLAAPSSSPTSPSYSGFIRVSIRVKPSPNAKLSVSPDGSITTINEQWTIDSTRNAISTKEVGEFVFDNIYHGQLPNSQIFDNSVKELIDQVMAGYNGTVFAYGMTGSGKTYSMQGNETNPGIIPLSAKAIFDHVNSPAHSDRSFAIKVAYLEIYNEHLHDLLSPSTQADDIKLRDDPVKGVRAIGLKEIPVSSPEELLQCIQSGDALRRTEGTEFNSKSSRSHAIVQISVESTPKTGSLTKTYSTLYLCDLAGSERAASQTERRKEGAYINKSLLTLGTVIAKLFVASTSPSGFNAGHVPYRDSKLTRLLQPALSGKSLVSILCTIDVNSPPGSTITNNSTISNTHVETISTLRFAARAKNIMVNVKKNEEQGSDSARIIEKLVQQVESLKLEVAQLKSSGGGGGGGGVVVPTTSTTAIGSKIITNGSLPVITAADQQQYITQIAQLEAENKILHERVEHLTRLCDDNRLEEVILGADEDGSAATTTTSSGVTSPLSTNSLDEENVLRKRIDEYESYIAHLEKQLEKQLYQASINNSININNLNNSLNISKQTNENASSSQQQQSTGLEVVDYTSPSLKSESSTFGVSTNGSAYGKYSSISSPTNSSFLVNPSPTSASFQSQGFYNELISELRDEIAELKESNNDKDRIISALRSINKRKENLSHALSSSSVGGYYTSSSSSTSSSPLSPSIPSMLPMPLSTSSSSSTTTTVTSGPASLNSVFSPSGISSPSSTNSSSNSAYNRYYFSSTSSSPPRTTVAIDSSSSSLGIGTAISTNSHNGTTTMSRCNSDGSNTSIESIKGRRIKSIDNNSKLNVVVGYSNITTINNNTNNNNEGLTLSPTSSITPSSGIRSPQRINNTISSTLKDKEFMNKEEEENISKNDCESVGERTLTDISVN